MERRATFGLGKAATAIALTLAVVSIGSLRVSAGQSPCLAGDSHRVRPPARMGRPRTDVPYTGMPDREQGPYGLPTYDPGSAVWGS